MERLSARIRHLFGRLDPSAHINRLERYKGLGWLVRNGVATQVMGTLAVGPLLVVDDHGWVAHHSGVSARDRIAVRYVVKHLRHVPEIEQPHGRIRW